jgi:branched-chain amino acid transport system substrate-binding protein
MRTLAVAAAILALWCAMVFRSAAAFAQPVPSGDKPPLLIGGSVAQTGMLADLAREYIKGLELWQEDVNARGGLAGRRVELRLFDDGSGARRAADVTEVLIAEDKVELLFGPFGSPATLEAAVIAERAHRIMLNATGAAPNIHRKALRYVFQLPPPHTEQALPVLKLAAMLGARTITVFAGRGAVGVLDRLREGAKLAGVGMIESSGLPAPIARPPNYPPLIGKIDPKSVLLVFDEVPRVADLLREMKRAGFRPPAFVAPNAVQPDYIRRVGMDAEYSFGLSAYEPRAQTRGNAEFVRMFQAKHKQPPDANAASGWAAGQLLEAAVERAASTETEPLRDALAALETETVLGAYKVDHNGAQVAASTMLVQILKGRREVIWPEAYRSAQAELSPPPWPKPR